MIGYRFLLPAEDLLRKAADRLGVDFLNDVDHVIDRLRISAGVQIIGATGS
ncbi:MAG TPA: hypothetical protein VE863_03190 [Pyrinomonadaceae bacterium]|jgi:hypothetical protein|nr:hypothetical protein [Pyrinomonadaceae bacterium]